MNRLIRLAGWQIILLLVVTGCNNPLKEQAKDTEKADEVGVTQTTDEGTEMDDAEDVDMTDTPDASDSIPFVDLYADYFYTSSLVEFEAPSWDFMEGKDLVPIEDLKLIDQLEEQTGFRPDGNYRYYYYSLQDCIPDFQEFVVYYNLDYGNFFRYCVFDMNNELSGSFLVAYDLAEGEYSEQGYGRFINENTYVLSISGFAEPYEGHPGEETYREVTYSIEGDGWVSEKGSQ